MKQKILVEGFHGTGGVRSLQSSFDRKLNRIIRNKVGKAGIPFDWQKGIHVQDHTGKITIKDQGQSDSCGGQAKAYWLGIVTAIVSGQPYTEQSAKSIYSRIYYPGGGTTVYNLEKDLGAVDEIIVSSQPPTETNLEDKSWTDDVNLKLAMSKAGWTAISVNIDMESIAEAIRDYGAIIWEITGQNNGTWLSNSPIPPTKTLNSSMWNHFMCSAGAGTWNGQQAIDMFQSWGILVGDDGIQHFTADYINSGYILDCFTFVKKKPNFVFTQDLKSGDQNNDVLQLQKRLGSWQTGYYGFVTWCAVNLYQYLHGITRTGICDLATRDSLNSIIN